MSRPTFLGIGAQRTGTTRLHQLLSDHPEIRMPTTGVGDFDKELHFFDRLIVSKDFEWYEQQFDSDDEQSPERVRGDITPSYSTLSPSVVAGISEYAPELRLVLIIRHPVERIWSQMKMRISSWSPESSIDNAGLSVRRLIKEAETYETILRTDYDRTIDIWTRVFDPEALLILLFEEQFQEPATTLNRVLRHIGADASWSPGEDRLRERVWAGPPGDIPEPFAYYLARRWLEPTEALNRRLDGRVDHWISDLRRTCDRGVSRFDTRCAAYRMMAWPRKARSKVRQVAKSRRLHRRLRRLLDERSRRAAG